MGHLTLSIFASFLIYIAYYTLLCGSVSIIDGKSGNAIESVPEDVQSFKSAWNKYANKKLSRPYALSAFRRERINPLEFEFIDDGDFDKRASMDDYGHLRFGKRQDGKRNQDWEDYGHMRFGRR